MGVYKGRIACLSRIMHIACRCLALSRTTGSMTALMAFALVVTGASQAQQTFFCEDGFGPAVDPPIPLASLKTVSNPVLPGGLLRGDLTTFIRNKDAAIQLGKALFWDMQAGSDNKTACATCHSHAGADRRTRNQLHPGPNGDFDIHGPNSDLQSGNFPFTDVTANVDADDRAGSQGIRKSQFGGFDRRTKAELTTSLTDLLFNDNGINVRQVTAIHTPPVVNAVFNYRNFWNGRAQAEFNGVNPFGTRDNYARVWMLGYTGSPVPIDILIQNAGLASQAVGPILNPVEMSAEGRTFPDVGKKMLGLKPLALQTVHPSDSVLGKLADRKSKGLKASYISLIQTAFQPSWWNSTDKINIGGQYYSMMEANFSLFWGLSIMLYESTLVSDDTPFDRYLDSGRTNPAVLDPVVTRLQNEGIDITRNNILNGLALFEAPREAGGVGCIECHGGAELTLASTRNVLGLHPLDADQRNQGFDFSVERMFMNFPAVPPGRVGVTYDPGTYSVTATLADGSTVPVPVAVYDTGFYDIGVRPSWEDPGLGELDPFGYPLSFTRLLQQSGSSWMTKVPGELLACSTTGQIVIDLSGPLLESEPEAIDGSFKTPSLRNVELTGPYFRNGGKSTLRQVVEFYDDGADFPANPNLAPLIVPPGLTEQQVTDLVGFLVALTDERVLWERAPFDHPQLGIPAGQNADGSDIMEWLPAMGAKGGATPLNRFLDLNAFQP